MHLKLELPNFKFRKFRSLPNYQFFFFLLNISNTFIIRLILPAGLLLEYSYRFGKVLTTDCLLFFAKIVQFVLDNNVKCYNVCIATFYIKNFNRCCGSV